MACVCKGICEQYRALGNRGSGKRYVLGHKRCQTCDIYIKWDGRRCPCCSVVLRTTPRSKKCKEKLRAVKNDL